MHKKIYIITASFITILVGIFIFLATSGIKTDNFNGLINEKVNTINPKIKLDLNDVNFKLNISNFEFLISTVDPKISINNKKIELESLRFNFNIFEYLNNKNPVSKMSIASKENNIAVLTDFINEYDFNLARNLILKQIKKGKVKILTDIIFEEESLNKFKYRVSGIVKDAEIKLHNQFKVENLQFDFQVEQDVINLKDIELSVDKTLITSNTVSIFKIDNQFKIEGDFKSNKNKINLNKYFNSVNINLDLINDQFINLSTDNKFSFKINKKLKVDQLNIVSKLDFDELYTKSKYQDFIFLNNGNILITYKQKELKIDLNSNFLFKNEKYNNNDSNNFIKATYIKKQNEKGLVNIDLRNENNVINSKEFKKFILLKNFSLTDQNITFSSQNIINFDLNDDNSIKNFNINSKVKTDNLSINYKSQRIKKYFSNFKNQVNLSNSNIDLEFSNSKLKFKLNSKYSINDINENINLKFEKKNNNYLFDLDIDLDSSEILIKELDYEKNADVKSNLYVNGIYKESNEVIFQNVKFNEGEKSLIIKNLELGKNDKIKNLDLFKIDLINKNKKKNEFEFKKVNNNYYLSGSEIDGAKSIKNILDNSSKSIFTNFKNLNTFIYVKINKYYINENSYLSNTQGEIQIKNNKLINSNVSAKLNKNRKFQLNIFTNNSQKITKLEIERPEPFISNFKFIKGFKEGSLIYESSEYEGKTLSNLKITDFKVQEVPVLAKLLTLASLQGIADLLTGEGIRFTEFEMDYETLGNTTNIKEIYAIGPAISLMMEGYIVKDSLTSLKGTLVPATTVNNTISKIPMLGEILVGKKIGEGVFGVSFKIKGPPKKLKTTVNPIKTLTPRFITRTLEKISN